MKNVLVRSILAGLAMTVSCGVAYADWEFTRWGMTPEQVVAASNGRASQIAFDSVSCTFKGTTCGAIMQAHAIGPYSFSVRFGFDDQRQLNSVLLYADGSRFYELERTLLGAFGQPISFENGGTPYRIWRDAQKGNRIRLLSLFGTDAILEYTPIAGGF